MTDRAVITEGYWASRLLAQTDHHNHVRECLFARKWEVFLTRSTPDFPYLLLSAPVVARESGQFGLSSRGGIFWLSDRELIDGVEITDRDRKVINTVIQWLGTNIGFCFLCEVLEAAGYKIIPQRPRRRTKHARTMELAR